MNRRAFLGTIAAAPCCFGQSEWGVAVVDIHLHPRSVEGGESRHLNGTGCAKAVLLPNRNSENHCREAMEREPGRFVRFANTDLRAADALEHLRSSVKGGSVGFGELKFSGDLDAPEARRIYALAAELNVPVLMHFQEGTSFSGFRRLPAIAKEYGKTRFIGHANSWWAHISADVDDKVGYPEGAIRPGGITDRLLSEFPNVYGDLSANSGRNALARDKDFSGKFLERHRAKLMFGSDCSCVDGHGTGQQQGGALKGKCTARETLTLLKEMTTPDLFRVITRDNATKFFGLSL
jgi:uncharacterized protein